MKTLLTISTLIFTVMFSSTSFAGWTKVTKNSTATFYVDFERIQKVDGYVYFWVLIDSLHPTNGVLSTKMYYQGDCNSLRYAILSGSRYPKPMGKGKMKSTRTLNSPEWHTPQPTSVTETILKSVCSR